MPTIISLLRLGSECLADGLVKGLALDRCNLELKFTRLAGSVGASKSARSPRRATMHLLEIRQLAESRGVSQGDKDKAMMNERGECADERGLLATAETGCTDECSGVLAREGSRSPQFSGRIPECLKLGGPVCVSRGYSEEERVVLRKLVGSNDGVVRLGWRVHFG